MKFKLLLLFIVSLLFHSQVQATHIVGGELNYKQLGGNDYEISLTVYRDCDVGEPPFDSLAAFGVFDANNILITYYEMPFLGLDTLEASINDSCYLPPTVFCYEVTTYIDTFNFPPINGGYQLVYQRCCRNQLVLNINNPEGTGASFYATIPDTSLINSNSNPVFKQWPPPFLCANSQFSFDHAAIDVDGDSLVYELYTPNAGATRLNPQPAPPNNPPYPKVIFIPPYSVNNMIGGDQPLEIDSETGLLTAIPTTLGHYVIGIICKEYRDGVYIGETKRDFQFIVKDCPKVVIPDPIIPEVHCKTLTVPFSNASTGAGSYLWHFGDPTTTSDTSNAVAPNYTYSSVGTYTVTLIAYAEGNLNCFDSTSRPVVITEKLENSYTAISDKCKLSKYYFESNVETLLNLDVNYEWSFGESYDIEGLGGESIPTSPSNAVNNFGNTSNTYDNPIHLYPKEEGFYFSQLITNIVGASNCRDTITVDPIVVGTIKTLFVPNTFTPNQDGKNDTFRVRGGNHYDSFKLSVYNRWGGLIFETSDPTLGWDGTFKGNPSEPAVYAWYLKANCTNEEEVFRKGNITLIR